MKSFIELVDAIMFVIQKLALILLLLLVIELHNHLKGGDRFRPWILTDRDIRVMIDTDLRLRECEFVDRRASILDRVDDKGNLNGKKGN